MFQNLSILKDMANSKNDIIFTKDTKSLLIASEMLTELSHSKEQMIYCAKLLIVG